MPDRFATACRTPIAAALRAVLFIVWASVSVADPVQVTTVPLGSVLLTREHSTPASVIARNAPQLAAEVDARVTALAVRVGDRVSAGQALATLDCRIHEAGLASARARLTSAQARQRFAAQQLQRARDLRKNKSISEELLDQRSNELEVSRADVDSAAQAERLAAIDVANCVIAAPFDAIVSERLVSVGDYVTRGKPLLGLVEASGQEVRTHLRHDQVASLRATGEIGFDSNGQRLPLRLRALLEVADPVARTREARLAFSATPALVGSAGRVTWSDGEPLLPPAYLVRRGDQTGVFLMTDGKARFVPLVDAQDGRPARIDLPPDSRLITDGRHALVDGAAVASGPVEAPKP